ncbi:MAG: methylated-DNA--[protein]-cysteine S-methyltransferase [Alphaproteobacteria bacterium]
MNSAYEAPGAAGPVYDGPLRGGAGGEPAVAHERDDKSDYGRVARAIRYLDAAHAEQPKLDEVARHVGLSPAHFQRLFTRWAGTSPKRFLAAVTLRHAKALLRSEEDVLDTALAVGLSGPSRLHDLFVTWEAMTPGDYKSGGHGLTIAYGVHDTPFGPALLLATERGICGLDFLIEESSRQALDRAAADWPRSRLVPDPAATAQWMERVFPAGGLPDPAKPPHLVLRGTGFQTRVWSALLKVPPGQLVSYSQLARLAGAPRAQRAVGRVMAENRIGWLVPCHRVIRASGAFGDYRWGPVRRKVMFGWEAARVGGVAGETAGGPEGGGVLAQT